LLVGIPIQGRLEIQPICVIGVVSHLALQNRAIALSGSTLLEVVPDRAEEGGHVSSNVVMWRRHCPGRSRAIAPDPYNSILLKIFPDIESSDHDLSHDRG
jgi:hypothetical protein